MVNSYKNKSNKKNKKLKDGGNNSELPLSVANGGFPPIFICDKIDDSQNDDAKFRSFSTIKQSVSIKQLILNKAKKGDNNKI